MLSICSRRFSPVLARPAIVAALLGLFVGRVLAGRTLLGLIVAHAAVLTCLSIYGAVWWRRRERSLARRAEAQLLVMTAHAEQALRRGEVTTCPSCQRPMRNQDRAARSAAVVVQARCLFCGAVRLPSLR